MGSYPIGFFQRLFLFHLAVGFLALSAGQLFAFQPGTWYEREDRWNGFARYHFRVGQQAAYLVAPTQTAAGKPWVWRARFPNYHAEIDIELLKRGFHIGYVDVAGMFGSPRAVRVGDEFYRYVRDHVGLAKRPTLEGVSRGGLFVYQWTASNPEKVASIFCDTPVCDIRSWPGGKGTGIGAAKEWKQCLAAYGINEEPVTDSQGSMVQHAELIADAAIPVLHVVTEDDQVVPPHENTYVLAKRFEQLGRPMQVISIEHGTAQSKGHHFKHENIEPIVNFIIHHQAKDNRPLEMVKAAERIIFLGDSITYAGEYVARFETGIRVRQWADPDVMINVGLPSETVSGLSEEGHAGGRFPRPDLHERLGRVLEATRPDLVFACYGINCGIYQPFDQTRFKKYQEGMKKLKSDVEAAGAKLILVTPPTFDDQRANKDFSYDAVMQRYTDWLNQQQEKGWVVVDLHTAMSKELESRRKTNPEFTFQPDAVHPNPAGHEVIAGVMLDCLVVDKTADEDSHRRLSQDPELDENILRLIRQRSHLWRDAYLTETGHKRPGIKSGEKLPVAQQRAEILTRQIDEWLKTTREE